MSGTKIATMIMTKDFQDYWQCVDERTSSLFSGATFLHYKAASYHTMLLAMHAAYLTACAQKGVPLACWRIGLTLLLKKVVGNNLYTNSGPYAYLKRISIGLIRSSMQNK